MTKVALTLLLGTLWLQATTCKDLCHKFGDHHGCQRLTAGEVDCTYPPQKSSPSQKASTPAPAQTTTPPPHATPAHFYTQWRERGGIRMRFEVTVGDDRMAFIGQAQPALDPYFFRFDPTTLESDHMLDATMHCQPADTSRYSCQDRYTHQTMTVDYHRTDTKTFDLKLYDGSIPVFRIYSDNRYVYTLYYRAGEVIERLSEHYPIVP